jgi:hypothetical protein
MHMPGETHGDGNHLWGTYANFFKVGFNAFEFVLCFGQSYSENQDEALCARIVTSPEYAKIFLNIMNASIKEYEVEYGAIAENLK